MSQPFGWLDLSTGARPAYSLVCEQATGHEGTKLLKYDGVWMTEKRANQTDRIKSKTGDREYFDYNEDGTLTPAKKFELTKLPYEIRHEILARLYDKATMPVYLRGNAWAYRTAIPLPRITQAGDRKLRLETILVCIKQTTLEIHSGPGNAQLQRWLSAIDFTPCETALRTGFDAVHSLSFPFFSRFPHAMLPAANPNNDIQLMLRCRNLRTIELNFVGHELTYYTNVFAVHAKPVTQLRSEYRLDSLLPLFNQGELRTIVLDGPTGGSGEEALQALAAWFRWEYAIRANMDRALAEDQDDSTPKSLSVQVNPDIEGFDW